MPIGASTISKVPFGLINLYGIHVTHAFPLFRVISPQVVVSNRRMLWFGEASLPVIWGFLVVFT